MIYLWRADIECRAGYDLQTWERGDPRRQVQRDWKCKSKIITISTWTIDLKVWLSSLLARQNNSKKSYFGLHIFSRQSEPRFLKPGLFKQFIPIVMILQVIRAKVDKSALIDGVARIFELQIFRLTGLILCLEGIQSDVIFCLKRIQSGAIFCL